MNKWFVHVRQIELDVWLYVLLVSGYTLAVVTHLDNMVTSITLALLAASCILLYGVGNHGTVRLVMVYFAVAAVALVPSIAGIALRQAIAPYQFAHDGMIQTEEAARSFLAGKNPYVENYFGTPLEHWWIPGPNELPNPALYHFVYLPFTFIFAAPFLVLAQSALGWFDLRLVFLPLFLVTLFLLPRFTSSPTKQRVLVLLFALNPFFVPFLAEGRNDAFVLFWLVLSVALLQAQHPVASAAAMACACATKQMAWFMLPFYALYVGKVYVRGGTSDKRAILRALMPFVVFALLWAVFVLPFFLWDSRQFIEDVFRYPTGYSEHPYPIKSLGFGGLALALGWIPNASALFPFERLQLLFGIPTLVALLWFLNHRPSISRLWLCCGMLTLVISFFSRVFNDNYLGYLGNLIVLGILSDDITV